MSRKNVIAGLLMVAFFALILTFSSSPSLAQPVEEPSAPSGWDEGRQVNSLSEVPGNPSLSALPTTPGTTYRTYSGGEFFVTSSSLTFNSLGGAVYATSLPPGGFSFSKELDLPQGAKITEVVFFVIDNDGTTNMDLSLRSYNPETNSFNTLASGSSSGASASLQIITLTLTTPVIVDNTTTSYRLRVEPFVASSAHLLRGARVGYIVSQVFLPSIAK